MDIERNIIGLQKNKFSTRFQILVPTPQEHFLYIFSGKSRVPSSVAAFEGKMYSFWQEITSSVVKSAFWVSQWSFGERKFLKDIGSLEVFCFCKGNFVFSLKRFIFWGKYSFTIFSRTFSKFFLDLWQNIFGRVEKLPSERLGEPSSEFLVLTKKILQGCQNWKPSSERNILRM